MSDEKYVARAELTIAAPPSAVFSVLADPQRHPEIDGSGTVRRVQESELPLRVGSTFDVHMQRGFPYTTRNTVLELKTDHVIAWSTTPLTKPLGWLIGGRVGRYELVPVGDGTRVTETWDLRPERNRQLVRPLAGDPAADMRGTLERLQRVVEGR
jgi:uncharacterized protein YndB with AHSA1/START domain